MTLSSIFHGRDGAAVAGDPALEAALQRLVSEARAAHPEVDLAPDVFIGYVAARTDRGDAVAALAALHAADLYLACACAEGNARALGALEHKVLPPLAAQLHRTAPALADEVLQVLRARVLVSESAAPPRITGYDGRGALGAWLRVAAARITVDLQRARNPHGSLEQHEAAGALPRTADPELAFLKTHYHKELADAFGATIAALPARDANVLRLHYLEETSAQTIAGIYGVSPRTVHHWIAEARRRILAETRRALSGKLRLSDADTDSIMRLAQSQLDITLHTILEKTGS